MDRVGSTPRRNQPDESLPMFPSDEAPGSLRRTPVRAFRSGWLPASLVSAAVGGVVLTVSWATDASALRGDDQPFANQPAAARPTTTQPATSQRAAIEAPSIPSSPTQPLAAEIPVTQSPYPLPEWLVTRPVPPSYTPGFTTEEVAAAADEILTGDQRLVDIQLVYLDAPVGGLSGHPEWIVVVDAGMLPFLGGPLMPACDAAPPLSDSCRPLEPRPTTVLWFFNADDGTADGGASFGTSVDTAPGGADVGADT